jgi:hypothetical protein
MTHLNLISSLQQPALYSSCSSWLELEDHLWGFCVFCIVDWHRWVTPPPQKWYTDAVDDARLSVTLQPTYAKAHACLD